MKRKLIITTLGIASLGINSVLMESVYSQIIDNNMLYDCYLESNQKLVGQVSVASEESPTSVCNTDIMECGFHPGGCYARPHFG